MKTPQLLATGSASINMTPMIDVVFLLIIFFLVSSHMAKQENNVPLDLPRAGSGLSDTAERHSLVVNVLANGSWRVGAAVVDELALAEVMRQRQRESTEPMRLKIRTDAAVPYSQIEPLLTAANRAGIGDIVFAVIEERRK
jgi:biopolymer transport protein ExbD